MDYFSICQAYIKGTPSRCGDLHGNLYGLYRCGVGTNSQSDIVYNNSGIFVDYPSLFCGNRRGIAPDLVAPGALEFNSRIEYGLDNCMQGGRSCFTQISTSSGGGEEWELYWMGSAGQSAGLVTSQSQCTLQPACSELELEVEGLPLSQQPTEATDEENNCGDRFGFPFGTYTGTIVQSHTNNQIPVELNYNRRGVIVVYPTMNCGNRLPIVPTVASPASMEWNERIEYGMDRCALGGRVSLTAISGNEWELFWVSSGAAPSGVASMYLRQPLCWGGGGGEKDNGTGQGGVPDGDDMEMVDPDMEEEEDVEEEDGEMVNANMGGEEEGKDKNNKDVDEDEDEEDDEEDDKEEDKDKDEEEDEEEDEEDEDEDEEENDLDLDDVESEASMTPAPTTSPQTTTGSDCVDGSGVAYGTFDGILTQSDNLSTYGVFVTYNPQGVTVDYPAFSCGNANPLVPVTVSGSIEWTETLDYGQVTCEGGGEVTLTEMPNAQWDFTWVGNGNGNGMVTVSGDLDFDPLC